MLPVEKNLHKLQSICRAVNILIWKVPLGGFEDRNEFAEYIVAELADKGILIRWNREKEQFYPERRQKREREAKKREWAQRVQQYYNPILFTVHWGWKAHAADQVETLGL